MRKALFLFIISWGSFMSFGQSTDFNYYKSLGTVEFYERDFLQAIFNFQKANTLKSSDKEVNNYLKMCYDSVGSKDLANKARMKMEKFGSPDQRPTIKPATLGSQPQTDGNKTSRSPIRRPGPASTDMSRDLRQLADYFMDRESYDSAAICYQHYVTLYPSDTATRFYLAVSQYFTRQYDDAIINYEIVSHKDPKRAELYNWIGVCELLKGNYLGARDEFKQCIKLDMDYSLAYFNLGKTEYELEDYGDAAKNLERAQTYMPGDTDLMKMLADIYYNTGNLDNSKTVYEKLYASNQKNTKTNYRLGEIYDRLGQWQKAITTFNNFLDLEPDNAEAHKKIGIAYYNIEKYAYAIDHFDKAAKTLFDDKELMLYASISANKLGDHQKALDYASRAITLDKNYVKAYYQMATAYKGMGRKKEYKEATAKVKDLEMNAVQLNPDPQ